MSVINQKEYLKKYLSVGNDKEKSKKRRKKAKVIKDRVKIIDDDIDLSSSTHGNEDECREYLTAEDAPQIVGIVDERPLSMRVDDYRKSDKWKLVGSDDEEKVSNKSDTIPKVEHLPINTLKIKSKLQSKSLSLESDVSLHKATDLKTNLLKNNSDRNPDSDLSPLRNNVKSENKHTKDSDSDISPPRKSRNDENSDSDLSPARPRKKSSSDDNFQSTNKQNQYKNETRKIHYSSDLDLSPPRRRKYCKNDEKPSSRIEKDKKDKKHDSDFVRKSNVPDMQIKRKDHIESKSKRSISSDRVSDKHPTKQTDRKSPNRKMTKTLDGKSAGLQNAEELKRETEAFKKREDELFKKMSAETTGANAAPVMRDRKTGKKRDLEKEAQEELEKQKKTDEQKEKYSRWGKGVKQVDEQKTKLEEDLYEMSKPLARYADDEDLEKYLKEQEREGDPMLQYIKKKKRKEAIATGKPIITKPHYEGEFMPNRFGIPPGHRWDGVDRSNGYEKSWFATQNSKKAVEEDIYKWSTEDM